jgi:hypothetical protein
VRRLVDDARSVVKAEADATEAGRRSAWALPGLGAGLAGLWALLVLWEVTPLFITSFATADHCTEIARRGGKSMLADCDAAIRERLPENFPGQVVSVVGSGARRELVIDYRREIEWLPGLKVPWQFTHRIPAPEK